jgi:hypothetical protein
MDVLLAVDVPPFSTESKTALVNKHHFGKGSKDVELKLYTFLILSPNRDK